MSFDIVMKDNPVFINNSLDKMEEILNLSQVNKEFRNLTVKNQLFWYYAMKKWFPNSVSSSSPYNINKDYRRTFAAKLGKFIN